MISWAIHELAKDMKLQERLHAEIVQQVTRAEDLSYDLVMGKSMPLLANVYKEVLRLYPATAIIARVAVADEALGGYHIPAGELPRKHFVVLTLLLFFQTAVALGPWAIGRNQKLWKEPQKFNPDRFN